MLSKFFHSPAEVCFGDLTGDDIDGYDRPESLANF